MNSNGRIMVGEMDFYLKEQVRPVSPGGLPVRSSSLSSPIDRPEDVIAALKR